MVTRIVKLTMHDYNTEKFKTYFATVSKMIRTQEGCQLLQAWQDIHHPEIFFTYSVWNGEEDLNKYRDSAFFLEFWKTVKPWFSAKAEVWTFNKIADLP
jgi:quinol monooxygenase YgiN